MYPTKELKAFFLLAESLPTSATLFHTLVTFLVFPDVRGGGQALHLADEDGGHNQHGGQVHTQGCLEEERLEEGGGKVDCSQKKGREVGGHHLACDLPLHDNDSTYPIFSTFRYLSLPTPTNYVEYWHVQFLDHF